MARARNTLLALGSLSGGVAWASTYGFSSNAAGDAGRKITLSTKGLPNIPCRSAESDVTWISGGRTLGIAIGTGGGEVWASGRDNQGDTTGCSASSSEYCAGGPNYDLSMSSVVSR